MITAEFLKRKINAARFRVPPVNRAKFDAEAAEFIRVISGADEATLKELEERWNVRETFLMSEPNAFKTPPCLIRRATESEKEFFNRCCEAGGFR